MLQPGADAPEFSVNDHNGNKINLKEDRNIPIEKSIKSLSNELILKLKSFKNQNKIKKSLN